MEHAKENHGGKGQRRWWALNNTEQAVKISPRLIEIHNKAAEQQLKQVQSQPRVEWQ